MKQIIVLLIASISFLQGADVSVSETDFYPRAINFILFVSILYYLIADDVRNFFKSNQEDIKNQLMATEKTLADSQKQKKIASDKISESEKMATEIIKTAKDESRLISKQYKEQTLKSVENMKKTHTERMALEKKKSINDITREVLNDFIGNSIDTLSKNDILDILNKTISKKVA